MKGFRVVDRTEVSLGPLWQQRENERKQLRGLVAGVQQKLNDLQSDSQNKEQRLEAQKSSLEHYTKVAEMKTLEANDLRRQLALLQAKFDKTQYDLTQILISTNSFRKEHEKILFDNEIMRNQLEDSRKVEVEAVKNEQLVRKELNELYEELHSQKQKRAVLDSQAHESKRKVEELTKSGKAGEKKITYLLKKISSLFQKLTECRSKLDSKSEPKKHFIPVNKEANATVTNLSTENVNLRRINKQLEKKGRRKEKEFAELRSVYLETQISLRNAKLARSLLQKRIYNILQQQQKKDRSNQQDGELEIKTIRLK